LARELLKRTLRELALNEVKGILAPNPIFSSHLSISKFVNSSNRKR
jgi:hypothetical protein